jgi:hypothetical protein
MCRALTIATEPKRYQEALAQVQELVERSKTRGEAEIEHVFRAMLYVLQDKLRKEMEDTPGTLLRYLDALPDDRRVEVIRRYCTFCGRRNDGPIGCTCMRDE